MPRSSAEAKGSESAKIIRGTEERSTEKGFSLISLH